MFTGPLDAWNAMLVLKDGHPRTSSVVGQTDLI